MEFFLPASEALGFGFVEVGTVTPLPQQGNNNQGFFDFPQDYALVNRMGFNNDGVHSLVEKIQRSFPKKKEIGTAWNKFGQRKINPLGLSS